VPSAKLAYDIVITEINYAIDSIYSDLRNEEIYNLPAFSEYIASKMGELRALNNIKALITIK